MTCCQPQVNQMADRHSYFILLIHHSMTMARGRKQRGVSGHRLEKVNLLCLTLWGIQNVFRILIVIIKNSDSVWLCQELWRLKKDSILALARFSPTYHSLPTYTHTSCWVSSSLEFPGKSHKNALERPISKNKRRGENHLIYKIIGAMSMCNSQTSSNIIWPCL